MMQVDHQTEAGTAPSVAYQRHITTLITTLGITAEALILCWTNYTITSYATTTDHLTMSRPIHTLMLVDTDTPMDTIMDTIMGTTMDTIMSTLVICDSQSQASMEDWLMVRKDMQTSIQASWLPGKTLGSGLVLLSYMCKIALMCMSRGTGQRYMQSFIGCIST